MSGLNGRAHAVRMTEDFVPFGVTAAEAETRRVLVDGIPEWMATSISAWISRKIAVRSTVVSLEKVREIESHCLLNLQTPSFGDYGSLATTMHRILERSDEHILRIVDFLLSQHPKGATEVIKLREILHYGCSKWTIGQVGQKPRLVERVPSGVQDAAEASIAAGGAAGALLGQAWSKVHIYEPDNSGAYATAVKAVEAASFPALGIANKEATLGNTIRTIDGGGWGLPFVREHNKAPSQEVLLGMLRCLWRGHRDRHGSDDYSDVDHDEALAAVTLAVTLVAWFAGGAVRPVVDR
jgi:hypothetical protein